MVSLLCPRLPCCIAGGRRPGFRARRSPFARKLCQPRCAGLSGDVGGAFCLPGATLGAGTGPLTVVAQRPGSLCSSSQFLGRIFQELQAGRGHEVSVCLCLINVQPVSGYLK